MVKSNIEPLATHQLLTDIAYDPETGEFAWMRGGSGRKSICGSVDKSTGYVRIYIHGKRYYAHRLAWYLHYGVWPDELDHRDRNRRNNRISNLRECLHSQNMKNRGLHKNNKSGIPGVRLYRGKYEARIVADGKYVHLGTFYFLDDAIAARQKALKELHGDFHA